MKNNTDKEELRDKLFVKYFEVEEEVKGENK